MRLATIAVLPGVAAATALSASTNTTQTAIDKLSSPLKIETWVGPHCQGAGGCFTIFNDSVLALNISNFSISRSFRLNRTLEAQEQLDLSVANDYATWYANKDQLSPNSSSCTNFWHSYYAVNGSTACHNTSPFTCHRLWNNPGL